MKLCRNRLHPRPEVGICLECRAAQRIRDKMKRASKPTQTQWERRAAKRRKEPAGPPEMDDAARTMRLLAIGDALNRNPMPWDRERLVAERAAIMAQKQKVEA